MATKAFKELKNLSKDELSARERDLRAQLFQTKIQRSTGQLENQSTVWKLRKSLARVLTLQSQAKAGK